MTHLNFDLENVRGTVKPINAVNNGPAGSKVRGTGNAALYEALEIPYARNHDASAYAGYGGQYTVDIHRIFENFDADENDPKSYLFGPTDQYVASTAEVGTKTFYRLGATIEHGFKRGTCPPRDFAKWARVAEHIIRHYTEGWADGFHYDMEYWEIWNEPDCYNPDGSNPCWQGTEAEFIDFFEVAAKHLKTAFPHLKIGGPAFTTSFTAPFKEDFFRAVKERRIPLDFYSFHGYMTEPDTVRALSDAAMASLEKAGLIAEDGTRPELIYNEWNYVRGWSGEDWQHSVDTCKGNKGASLSTGAMCVGQESEIDMMMYYDARPCRLCGLFESELLRPLKTYYAFLLIKELRRLGGYVKADAKRGNVYSCAATDGKNSAVILTHFNDRGDTGDEEVKVSFEHVKSEKGVRVTYLLLDDTHNATPMREEIFTAEHFSAYLTLKLYDTYLIRIEAL